MQKFTSSLMIAVSAGALSAMAGVAPAFAQDESADGETRDVIIVTSQRREQNILDVPTSVSVIDDAAVEARNIRGSRE